MPDLGVHREPQLESWVPTAAIAVEILSPGDDTWAKLPFYAQRDVDELLIVDPAEPFRHMARAARGRVPADRSQPDPRPGRVRARRADRLAKRLGPFAAFAARWWRAASQDRDVGVVADHEAVGARLAVAAADRHVAPQQRGLHAPVQVAHAGSPPAGSSARPPRRRSRSARRSPCTGRCSSRSAARPRRRSPGRAPSCAPGARPARSPRARPPASRSARPRCAPAGCRGSGGWPPACPPGAPCPSTSRARCAAPRAAPRRPGAGSRR